MRIAVWLVVGLSLFAAGDAQAQAPRRRAPVRKPAPLPELKTAPAATACPEKLGTGVRTGASFCFVLAGD
ncbi:MAG: hypothetical protein ABI818_20985, partial [Acidobacteriota bacterium]